VASVGLSRLLPRLLLRSLCAVLFFNFSRLFLLSVPPRHFSLGLFLTLDLFLAFHEATLTALCHTTPLPPTAVGDTAGTDISVVQLRLIDFMVHPLPAFGRECRLVWLLEPSNKKPRKPRHRLRD
jgi:hypothetical protein